MQRTQYNGKYKEAFINVQDFLEALLVKHKVLLFVLCFYRYLVSLWKWLCHIPDRQTQEQVKAARIHDAESSCIRLWHIR